MYRIGAFAQMVGLPASKIRYYDKFGLFSGERDFNGYRYFTTQDAFRVNAFRVLQQYGFSVEESIVILNKQQSNREFVDSLYMHMEDLEKELQILRFRQKRLQATIELLTSEVDPGFTIKEMEDYLYVRASHGMDFSVSNRNSVLIRRFAELLSVTSYARIIDCEDLLDTKGSINPSYVLAIPESNAYMLGSFNTSNLLRLELGTCVHFYRKETREESVQRESFRGLFRFLDENGYNLRGDSILFPAFLNLNGHGVDIESLYIPIKK